MFYTGKGTQVKIRPYKINFMKLGNNKVFLSTLYNLKPTGKMILKGLEEKKAFFYKLKSASEELKRVHFGRDFSSQSTKIFLLRLIGSNYYSN